MIRLPSTSISLSADDVSFHMRDIDIYHGLLVQGFKKKDILRYYHEQKIDQPDSSTQTTQLNRRSRQDLPRQSSLLRFSQIASPPSPFESCASVSELKLVNKSEVQPVKSPVEDPSALTVVRKTRSTELADEVYASHLKGRALYHWAYIASGMPAPVSMRLSSSPESLNSARRRQSVDISGAISRLSLHEANAESSPSPRSSNDGGGGSFLSPLRPEAKIFVPLALPAPFSAINRTPSGQYTPQSSRLESSLASGGQERLVHPLPLVPTASSTSPDGMDFPSSPLRNPIRPAISSPASHAGPLPITPPARRRFHQVRTEPRSLHNTHVDGSTVTVYNDSLPPDSQPKTPADLSRAPILTDYHTAYTAPPGTTGRGSVAFAHRVYVSSQNEESPTRRAIGMRERRTREFLRAARVEGTRSQRVMIGKKTDPGDVMNGLNSAIGLWRDDLEADRVGEENFERDHDRLPRRMTARRWQRAVNGQTFGWARQDEDFLERTPGS